jgi:hypothetical protein
LDGVASDEHWRASDEVKVSYNVDNSPAFLWAAWEGFLNISSNTHMNQHRALLGVGEKMGDHGKGSVGYMLQSNEAPALNTWVNSHFVFLSFETK